ALNSSVEEPRVYLEGVSWQQYEALLSTLGDDFPALRLSYLDGTLEVMTTSPLHEELKKIIGMLLEAYLQETRTRFHGIGSATFRRQSRQRGLEPDECYCIGERKEIPDIAVEIVLTSGIVDKLDIYQGLGIKEIWVWESGRFTLYQLQTNGYETISRSELLPKCDIDQLAQYVKPKEQFDAVMDYREAIRQSA
ncbi:MAG: Uma2 family endonuclease, partial [Cyanobacteria bacterium J06631_9]